MTASRRTPSCKGLGVFPFHIATNNPIMMATKNMASTECTQAADEKANGKRFAVS